MNPLHLFLLLALSALTASTVAYAAADTQTAADLQMAADSAPFRDTARDFITRAMAGDVDGTQTLLSRQLVGRIGDAAARKALQAQILPFFQRGQQPGGAITVTQTTDAAGQQGFAFYWWMHYAEAPKARPFAVYVVKEQGRLVVANVVPDRLVDGRHR